jgi:ribosomal-protein-alanine N-acetyltransferase
VTLSTTRLLLRDLREADFEAVHEYAADPKVVRYTTFGPNTEEQTRAFLTACALEPAEVPRRSYTLGVIDRTSGQLIGSCGIMQSDGTARQFMLGYCFSRAAWNQGYGKETARALARFGFETLNAHRLWALVFLDNLPSARILEGLGFRREGLARQSLFARGAWHDVITFAQLRSEYITGD